MAPEDLSTTGGLLAARRPTKSFEGRANYPTFKKKQNDQAATYASNAFTWDGKALILAKMDAPLDIRLHRPLPVGSKPTTITISKDSAHRYFVSLLVEEDMKPLPVTPKMVGLDLGLKTMLATSDGQMHGNLGRVRAPVGVQSQVVWANARQA